MNIIAENARAFMNCAAPIDNRTFVNALFYSEAPVAIREVCGIAPPPAALHQFKCVLRQTKYSHDVGTRWRSQFLGTNLHSLKSSLIF